MSRVASLQVEIGANVSGFQAAAAQVKSGLKGIENAAKTAGGGIAGAGSRIDQFNTKARALEEAYASGTISARQYASQGRALAWSMMSAGEKFDVVRQKVNSAGMELVKLGAAGAAVGLATKKVYEFAATGAQIEYTQQKFDRLAKSVGSTGNIFMNDLRLATRGTVSDFDLLKQGADLLQLGLAKDTAEAARLSRVMTALGMDTGEMTLALANQSKRRLDQLGLSLSRFNQIEAGLKDKGMTKEEAFKEAFLQTAEQTIAITGNQADSQYGQFLKFQAEAANIWNSYKQALPSSSMGLMFGNQSVADVMGQLAGTMRMLKQVASPEYGLGAGAWNPETTRFEFDVRRTPQYYQQPGRPQAAGFGMTYAPTPGGRGREQIRVADDYLQAAAYYTRQESAATGGGGGGMTPEDYASALSAGLDLTSMTKEYSDKTAALNEKLAEESDKLAELTKRYGENSKNVEEQRDKVNAIQSDIVALGESYQDSTNAMALGTLKNKNATDEQQLAYARASGMISQNAYEQADALSRITDAYVSGKLSAEDYASGVGMLKNIVGGMSGLQVNSYIDVWIRVHGQMPKGAYAGPQANTTTTSSALEALRVDTGGGRWTGGPLNSNGFTIVGDAPGGMWTPHTEVVGPDGYVYNAEQAKILKRAGALEGATAMREGSEGYQGSYYTGPRVAARRFTRSGSRNITGRTGASGGTTTAQVSKGDVAAATTAAVNVSDAAVTIASQAIGQTQNIVNNMQGSTSQTVAAQRENANTIVDKLDSIERRIAKQATKDDLYALWHSGQQQSI